MDIINKNAVLRELIAKKGASSKHSYLKLSLAIDGDPNPLTSKMRKDIIDIIKAATDEAIRNIEKSDLV